MTSQFFTETFCYPGDHHFCIGCGCPCHRGKPYTCRVCGAPIADNRNAHAHVVLHGGPRKAARIRREAAKRQAAIIASGVLDDLPFE